MTFYLSFKKVTNCYSHGTAVIFKCFQIRIPFKHFYLGEKQMQKSCCINFGVGLLKSGAIGREPVLHFPSSHSTAVLQARSNTCLAELLLIL